MEHPFIYSTGDWLWDETDTRLGCQEDERGKKEMQLNAIWSELDQLFATGQTDKVESYLKEQIECAKMAGELHIQIALWSELGGFYRSCGRLEESAVAFLQALEDQGKTDVSDFMSKATLFINLAGTRRLQKQLPQALTLYDEAERLLQNEKSHANYYMYATLFNNRSLVYQDMGELEKASAVLQEALAMMEAEPQFAEELATTYTNLALLEGQMGHWQREQEYIRKSLQIYKEKGLCQQPHYAAALSALGGSLYHSGQLDEAIQAYEQAGKLMYRLFGANREYQMIQANLKVVMEAREKR